MEIFISSTFGARGPSSHGSLGHFPKDEGRQARALLWAFDFEIGDLGLCVRIVTLAS